MVKNLPAMQETRVWSLGWEDPREKGMTTHSRILAWRIPGTEEPGRLQSKGFQRVRHNWVTNTRINHYLAILRNTSCYPLGFPSATALIPELGRSPGGRHGNHSSILAWRVPWTEEPGGLWSTGSHRVGHNWSNLACMPSPSSSQVIPVFPQLSHSIHS